MSSSPDKNYKDLIRYAGLGMQIMASLGLTVFIGIKLDGWVKLSFPVFSWLLPLLVIIALIVKLIKESSRKRK